MGRAEFVRNTLNSIYTKKNLLECNLSDFEVIISDNDPERSLEFLKNEFSFDNFRYYSTDCEGFLNSHEVLRYAHGYFLKLHNSQEIWNPGALSLLINFIKTNLENKPLVFFTSGLLLKGTESISYSFDTFMYNLSYLSSWSNGFSIWKEDFDKVSNSLYLNKLFPHTSILLTQINKKQFIVNDMHLFTTQFVNKRGGHNKFHAFSIEYPSLIDSLWKNGNINSKTKSKIFKDILFNYLPLLFFNVKIAKRETFGSEGFRQDIKIYFPKGSFYIVFVLAFFIPIKIIWRKIKINYLLKSEF